MMKLKLILKLIQKNVLHWVHQVGLKDKLFFKIKYQIMVLKIMQSKKEKKNIIKGPSLERRIYRNTPDDYGLI